MSDLVKNLFLWLIIAAVVMLVFQNIGMQGHAGPKIRYSEFIQDVKTGRVTQVELDGRTIHGEMADGLK